MKLLSGEVKMESYVLSNKLNSSKTGCIRFGNGYGWKRQL